MPRYAYKCNVCGYTTTEQFSHAERPDSLPCPLPADERTSKDFWCGGLMDLQPSAPNFAVKGFNAKNRYGRTE